MSATRSRLGSMALLCLYQHRLMSTGQLRRLLIPAARNARYLQRELARPGRADPGRAGPGQGGRQRIGRGLPHGARRQCARPGGTAIRASALTG
jgi:hypothetical protein